MGLTLRRWAQDGRSWIKCGASKPTTIAVAFYFLWSIIATYPLALAPANHIENWGDPLLNVWIIGWDLHQLGRDPLHLFNAPIFYPAPNTLALSELLLGQAIEALPIVALTGNFVLAYNLIVLLSFVACGYCAYLLARELLPPSASLVTGAAYAFSFYRVGEYSHIQILSAQWIPLALLGLIRLWRKERWRDAALLGVSVVLQLLSSFYLGLFLLVALLTTLVYLIVADRRLPRLAFAGRLAAAGVITVAVVLPFSLPYFQVEREFGLTRSLGDATGGSATFRSYLTVPPTSLWYGLRRVGILQHFQTDETLFPGFLTLALAIVGGIAIVRRRRGAFFLCLALAGLIFSLGPTFRLGSDDNGLPLPYRLLYLYVPGFHSIRVVGRLGVVTTLGIAGLAGLGAAAVGAWLPARRLPVVGLVLATLISLETLSIPTRLTPVETPSEVPPVYQWLALKPDGAPALELPTIEERWLDHADELERQGHEQYLSIFHWHPTPSGYSGFEPPLFWSVIRQAKDLPTDESTTFFQCLGLKYVVFHQNEYQPDRWRQIQARLAAPNSTLTPLATFGQDSVYQLASAGRIDRLPSPWIDLPSAALADGTYRGFLIWPNAGPASNLDPRSSIGIHIAWVGAASSLSHDITTQEPGCVTRGYTAIPFDVQAPTRPGRYTLSVDATGATGSSPIDVTTAPTDPIPNDPRPALQLLSGDLLRTSANAGDVVFVQTTWRLRHRTLDNYLLRLEVEDAAGHVVASSTIDPFDGALETSHWIEGESVRLGQSAILPAGLGPGSYSVRTLVRYADGAAWKLAGPDNNDHDSVVLGTVTVQ
jgi:hypothetical protein